MTQNSGKLNILVLDDEKRLRDELGEFLIKRDHKIYPAATPDEAFLIFEQQKIDIAIVDIRLPGMSGLELLKRIKLTRPDLEVIMISGHGDMQSVIEALRYGAVDYFQKPFRMPDVQYAIERTSKYYAHDDSDALEIGQKIRLMETRPLSKLKRWRVVEAL